MGLGIFSNIILFFCLSVMAASPPASSRAADAAGLPREADAALGPSPHHHVAVDGETPSRQRTGLTLQHEDAIKAYEERKFSWL